MNDIRNTLREIGLTESEVKVYTKLMQLKKATIAQLSRSLKMHRPNIYDNLKRLIKKGLIFNNNGDYYIEGYEKISDYIEVMKSNLDEKKIIINPYNVILKKD